MIALEVTTAKGLFNIFNSPYMWTSPQFKVSSEHYPIDQMISLDDNNYLLCRRESSDD
jgi:hypothetical protein